MPERCRTIAALVLMVSLAAGASAQERVLSGDWVLRQIEGLIGDVAGLDVEIGNIDVELLQSEPLLRIEDFVLQGIGDLPLVSIGRVEASVVSGSLLTGDFRLGVARLEDVDANLFVDESGRPNWQPLLAGPPADEPPAGGIAPSIPAINEIELAPVDVAYVNRATGQEAAFVLEMTGATAADSDPVEARLDGEVNGVPIVLEALFSELGRLAEAPAEFELALDLAVGDANRISVAGPVFDSEGYLAPDLRLELAIDAPATLLAAASQAERPLPVVRASTQIGRDGDVWLLNGLDAMIGDTDLNGDIRADPSTQPPTLYANLATDTLHLDALLADLGIPLPGAAADAAAEEASEEATESEPAEGEPPRRVLPDDPIAFELAMNRVLGGLRYRIDSVESDSIPLDDARVSIDFEPSRLLLDQLALGLAGGTVLMDGSLDMREDVPRLLAGLDIRHLGTGRLLSVAGLPQEITGDLGGQAKFWLRGNSVAELLGGLDGGMFLVMDGGQLDALIVEALGVDIAESLAVLLDPGDETVELGCTYLNLFAADGRLDIEEFLIDTQDTLLLADGRIDFGDETLSIAIEPQARDFSPLSAPTRVAVEGPFSAPSFGVGGAGLVGAAAAAVVGPIISGAVALVPFLAVGAEEAIDEPPPACSALGTLLEESDS